MAGLINRLTADHWSGVLSQLSELDHPAWDDVVTAVTPLRPRRTPESSWKRWSLPYLTNLDDVVMVRSAETVFRSPQRESSGFAGVRTRGHETRRRTLWPHPH